MKPELQKHYLKAKGLGHYGLILFSLVVFGLCAAGIYLLTASRNKKLAAIQKPAYIAGFTSGNTYINPMLGWKINFPQDMTLLDQDQMRAWPQLPEIYGFEAMEKNQINLFLAMGETFSVVALAWIEPLQLVDETASVHQLIANEQERLLQAISRKTLFESNYEISEVLIDSTRFFRMNIKFMHSGDEQKQQDIFTGVVNSYLLNISLVYYKPAAGSQLISAIMASEFGH